MDFRDKADEARFRAEVRSFIASELPDELRKKEIGYGDFDYGEDPGPLATRWREKLRERGWIAPAWPREYGGAGMDTLAYAIAVEEVARACGSTAITLAAHVSLGCGPVFANGTEEQRMKYLVPMAKGEAIGAFGLNGGIHDALSLADKLGRVCRGEAEPALLDRYERQRRTVNLEYVQEASIRNLRRLAARDPEERRRHVDELRRAASTPDGTRQFLLGSSMIASVRRAEAIA